VTLALNNGVAIPALGFGVFQTPPDETVGAVEAAIRVGYRLIDTAASYMNEREVGEGIRRSGIARTEIFIETKLWISDYGYDSALHAFDKSARKLGVDQIDLLLLHQPLPSAFELTLDAYRALETLLGDGRVRAIGVSNFMPDHLERLLAETSTVPAVNQVEVHPYFQQTALQRLHAERGILTQAWSPIGGITSYRGAEKRTFDDPTLAEIGHRHRKSPAQVMLAGTSRKAAPRSRSQPSLHALPRILTFSSSNSLPRRSRRSTRSTPASAADPTPTRSPSQPSEGRSQRRRNNRRSGNLASFRS
jgi:diketogulonate reductase-like aldo/keto reductase